MIYAKIATLCLGLACFGTWAFWGEASVNRRPLLLETKTIVPGVSPETRNKAFDLLERVVSEAETSTRRADGLAIQFHLADLLWEKDRGKAAKLFTNISQNAEKDGCSCDVVDLNTIAARDAKLALEISEASRSRMMPYQFDPIYEYLILQYPDEALSRGKKAVQANEFLPYLDVEENFLPRTGNHSKPDRLSRLYAANRTHGANLARDILEKLRAQPIEVPTPFPNYNTARANSAPFNTVANRPSPRIRDLPLNLPMSANFSAANYAFNGNSVTANRASNSIANAVSPASSAVHGRVPFSAAAAMLTAAITAGELAAKNGGQPMLSDEEIKALALAMATSLSRTRKIRIFAVRSVWGSIKRYAPGIMDRVERRLTPGERRELLASEPDFNAPDRHLYDQIPAAVNETAAAKEEREFVNDVRYYSKVTNHCNEADDAEKFAALRNPEKYPDLIAYFAQYLPTGYAKAGKLQELRPLLVNEKNRLTRLRLLSLAATALVRNGNKAGAKKLIDEATPLLPSDFGNRDEFGVAEVYALALSYIDPARGFDLTERLLDKGNRMINLRDELVDFRSSASDPMNLIFSVRRGQVATHSEHSIAIIRVLANADFNRTVKLADRFSNAEQRLFFRWHIVNALLNSNAEFEEGRFADKEPCG